MRRLDQTEAQQACCARLGLLQSDARPRWGRMTAHQMVCHLSDSFKAAVGKKTVSPATMGVPKGFMKFMALHMPLQWPKNIPTRPEVEQGRGGTAPADWTRDCAELRTLILSFASESTSETHPIFGPMTHKDWQIWGYRHVDHHFRQFGV